MNSGTEARLMACLLGSRSFSAQVEVPCGHHDPCLAPHDPLASPWVRGLPRLNSLRGAGVGAREVDVAPVPQDTVGQTGE